MGNEAEGVEGGHPYSKKQLIIGCFTRNKGWKVLEAFPKSKDNKMV